MTDYPLLLTLLVIKIGCSEWMRSIPSFSRSEMIAADKSTDEHCSPMDVRPDGYHRLSTN
jgi:hypothetical protein